MHILEPEQLDTHLGAPWRRRLQPRVKAILLIRRRISSGVEVVALVDRPPVQADQLALELEVVERARLPDVEQIGAVNDPHSAHAASSSVPILGCRSQTQGVMQMASARMPTWRQAAGGGGISHSTLAAADRTLHRGTRAEARPCRSCEHRARASTLIREAGDGRPGFARPGIRAAE